MAVDMRCEQCGKLLTLEAQPGDSAICPHCGKRLVVGRQGAGQPDAADVMVEDEPGNDAVFQVMSRVMPWVISVFFHAAIALVMVLIVVVTKEGEAPPIPPDNPRQTRRDQVERKGDENPKSINKQQARQPVPTMKQGFSQQDTPNPMGTGFESTQEGIIGEGSAGSGGGQLAAMGLSQPGGGGGAGFLGASVRAKDIVYVIDKSGSMEAGGRFEILRIRLAQSIGALDENQQFHLIFFGEEKDKPVEYTPGRLVPATFEYKSELAGFLDTINPGYQTHVIPALKRAFDVLEEERENPEKVIFLLSDGDFAGDYNEFDGKTGNEAVLAYLKRRNPVKSIRDAKTGKVEKRPEVRIFTFLYGGDNPDDVKVMKQIAEENDGHFKQVSKDE